MKLYEVIRFFRRGEVVAIKPTLKCNYKCPDCAEYFDGKYLKRPDCNIQLSAFQWYDKIMTLHPRIKNIIISGGEPTIYPEFAILTNLFLDSKIPVAVATNLSIPGVFKDVRRSRRLYIHSTFYPDQVNQEVFKAALEMVRSMHYYVGVYELYSIDGSRRKKRHVKDEDDVPGIFYGPDGAKLGYCQETTTHYI